MNTYLQKGLTVGVVVFPALLLFGVLEVAGRVYERRHPPLVVDLGQGFDADSLLFQTLPGGRVETRPEKRVSFQRQQFQSTKPPGVVRIVALGGSSVNYLDYEFSVLARELSVALRPEYKTVEIINCGGLSYGSHRLTLVAAEMLRYEPDVVLIYSGHNEFEELQQLRVSHVELASVQRALGRSGFYRVVRDTLARRAIARLEETRAQRELAASIPDSSKAWLHVFTPAEIEERMDAFESNLTAIIAMFQARGVPVLIGTVPSNLWRPNLPGEDGALYEEVIGMFQRGAYAEGVTRGRAILRNASPRHQSSDVENAIIRRVAAAHGIPLADVEGAIIAAEPNGVPGETLFGDHCHLNPEGNRILRETFQSHILRLPWFRGGAMP